MASWTPISLRQCFFPLSPIPLVLFLSLPHPFTHRSRLNLLLVALESLFTCPLLLLVAFLVLHLHSDSCVGCSHLESQVIVLWFYTDFWNSFLGSRWSVTKLVGRYHFFDKLFYSAFARLCCRQASDFNSLLQQESMPCPSHYVLAAALLPAFFIWEQSLKEKKNHY